MTITVNSLTKRAISIYAKQHLCPIAFNGIYLENRIRKLCIMKTSGNHSFFVYSWKKEHGDWKMDWDIAISKEGIRYDN